MRALARRQMRFSPAAGALLLAAALGAPPLGAQPHDACVNRTYVTFLPFDDLQPIGGAGLDPGETPPACRPADFAHSVWYGMTPPLDGVYAFSTCGSDFDTVVQVYDGPFCEVLEQRPGLCNDDSDLCGPGSRQSVVLFRKGRGPSNVVHAQVGSSGPAAGTLRFSMRLVPEARNDRCEAARVIGHPVFRDVVDIARTGGGEPVDRTFLTRCGAAGNVVLGEAPHSVWYRYTPARSGPVVIDTAGTTTPVVVAVFHERAEGCARLGSRAACAANRPALFSAVAGRPYLIYVATPSAVPPDILVLRLTGPNAAPLARPGPAQTVAPGVPVALDARASLDPDGDPITFAWTQTAGPAVMLSDPAAAAPAFTAPLVDGDADLDFALAVSDGAAVSRATVRVTVSPSVADADRDGVPLPFDRCPDTPAGEAVDAEGCACVDRGRRACPGTACAPGRCDPLTAECVPEPAPLGTPCPDDGDLCTHDFCDGAGSCAHPPVHCARECREERCDPATGRCAGPALPAGTRCADDGDPCTEDVCDASGACMHGPVGSFPGAACQLDALRTRFGDGPGLTASAATRLTRLLVRARAAVAEAEVAAVVDDPRRARRRLARARRALARFTRRIARLEARGRIPPSDAGALLEDARVATARITDLRAVLPAGGARRATP